MNDPALQVLYWTPARDTYDPAEPPAPAGRRVTVVARRGKPVAAFAHASGDGARVVGLGVPLLGGLDDVADAVRASDADTVAVT